MIFQWLLFIFGSPTEKETQRLLKNNQCSTEISTDLENTFPNHAASQRFEIIKLFFH